MSHDTYATRVGMALDKESGAFKKKKKTSYHHYIFVSDVIKRLKIKHMLSARLENVQSLHLNSVQTIYVSQHCIYMQNMPP